MARAKTHGNFANKSASNKTFFFPKAFHKVSGVTCLQCFVNTLLSNHLQVNLQINLFGFKNLNNSECVFFSPCEQLKATLAENFF